MSFNVSGSQIHTSDQSQYASALAMVRAEGNKLQEINKERALSNPPSQDLDPSTLVSRLLDKVKIPLKRDDANETAPGDDLISWTCLAHDITSQVNALIRCDKFKSPSSLVRLGLSISRSREVLVPFTIPPSQVQFLENKLHEVVKLIEEHNRKDFSDWPHLLDQIVENILAFNKELLSLQITALDLVRLQTRFAAAAYRIAHYKTKVLRIGQAGF